MMKRKRSSYLWNYFTELNSNHAQCDTCGAKLSYRSSTSNLKKHFVSKHPTLSISHETKPPCPKKEATVTKSELLSSTHDEELLSQTTSTSTLLLYDQPESDAEDQIYNQTDSPNESVAVSFKVPHITSIPTVNPIIGTPTCQQSINEKMLALFTDSLLPFHILEEPGFRNFIAALHPFYEIPSRHDISDALIPAKYEQCLKKTRDAIRNALKLTVTTDCWTSVNMDRIMAVTVHFLNENFKLVSLLLECISLPSNHTSSNLTKELERVLTEWDVKEKVILVIPDKTANINAEFLSELGWKHFDCFGGTINLVVNDGLEDNEAAKMIGKVRDIVSHYKRNDTATMSLLLHQQNQGRGSPLKLLQDVPNRWNSTYYMLERFILLNEAVRSTIALTSLDAANYPTEDEWDTLRQLCQIFKPLEKLTRNISCEEYLTASLVIPLANGLDSVYKGFLHEPLADCVKNVVRKLVESLATRLGKLENNSALSLATYLDPRFKEIAFKDKRNADRTQKEIIFFVADKFSVQKSQSPKNDPLELTNQSDSDDDVWAEFEKEASIYKPSGTSTSKAIAEVQKFLDTDRLQRKEDPLIWWRENKCMFPQLASVSQELLSVIVTSVPCKRLFTKAGHIISERRSQLSSTKLNMLLFLNANLKMF